MGMLIYAKLIIVFPPNLELSPYSEVIHGSATFKLTKSLQRLKKMINCSIWCGFFFIFFNPKSQTVSAINRCGEWCMLFFTCINIVMHVLVCSCSITHIKWIRLELELPKNCPTEELYKPGKSKFWKHQFFSIVTFK